MKALVSLSIPILLSKKVKKSGASDKVTMEQHETDMGKLQNSVLYRIKDMEDKVEAMEDKFEAEKKNLVNNFEEQIRSKNAELAAMKADLQKMKNIKDTFEKDIKSNGNEIAEMKIELKRVNNLIEEETSSRIFLNKEIEKESSHLGSKITKIVSTISNSDLGNLKEKTGFYNTFPIYFSTFLA